MSNKSEKWTLWYAPVTFDVSVSTTSISLLFSRDHYSIGVISQKAWIIFKVHAFLILREAQDIGAAEFFLKRKISPTKLELSASKKFKIYLIAGHNAKFHFNCYIS
jgi:hypothetical protein